MARAFKCDRCGELYSNPLTDISIIALNAVYPSVTCIYYGRSGNWTSDRQDLCPKCMQDLKVWWEHSNISAQHQLDKIISEMNSHEMHTQDT